MTSQASSFTSPTAFAQPHPALAHTGLSPWRRILAVEPDVAVLKAKSLILANSNYCVTPASSDGELFTLRHMKPVSLAILSDRLASGF